MPIETDIIQRHKLSEEVVARIEKMINQGVFAAGDRLPSERELTKLFGVGRPAIREGLFSLQKMGLVAVGNGARARVTRPTPDVVVKSMSGAVRHLLAAPGGVENFQEARTFFEAALAREAAQRATASDIQDLQTALAANREAIDNIDAFDRTDTAFHYVLALVPRNPIYTAINEALLGWLTEQRRISSLVPKANETAYRDHKKIFEAIADRDPDAAEKAMRSHLGRVAKFYHQGRESHPQPLAHSRAASPDTRSARELPKTSRAKR